MDAQLTAWLDQQDMLVAHNIRKHGVHIEYVFGEREGHESSFAYTVGLFGLRHPELLVFGLSTSRHVLRTQRTRDARPQRL